MVNCNFLESELVQLATERHEDTVSEISQLMEYFAESGAEEEEEILEKRIDLRFPICTRIRVTPCDDKFVPTGSENLAYTRNLSASGARLLLSADLDSKLVRVDFDNSALPFTLIMELQWQNSFGDFVEAGGSFFARL